MLRIIAELQAGLRPVTASLLPISSVIFTTLADLVMQQQLPCPHQAMADSPLLTNLHAWKHMDFDMVS